MRVLHLLGGLMLQRPIRRATLALALVAAGVATHLTAAQSSAAFSGDGDLLVVSRLGPTNNNKDAYKLVRKVTTTVYVQGHPGRRAQALAMGSLQGWLPKGAGYQGLAPGARFTTEIGTGKDRSKANAAFLRARRMGVFLVPTSFVEAAGTQELVLNWHSRHLRATPLGVIADTGISVVSAGLDDGHRQRDESNEDPPLLGMFALSEVISGPFDVLVVVRTANGARAQRGFSVPPLRAGDDLDHARVQLKVRPDDVGSPVVLLGKDGIYGHLIGMVSDQSDAQGWAPVVSSTVVLRALGLLCALSPGVTRVHAFLGIGVQSTGGTLLVTSVDPLSQSAAAGIEVGMTLVKLDGQPLISFDQYRGLVRSHKVGDSAALTVLQDGQPRTITVTFGAAGDS